MKAILICLTLSAWYSVCYSQTDKTVTFDEKNVTIKKIITIIWQQTEIPVFYSDADIENASPITMKVTKMPIKQLMDSICRNQPFKYDISDNLITLYKAERITNKDSSKKAPEKIPISGKITDQNGMALAGASIMIKGTTQGTTADDYGYFTIKVVDENAELEISFVGYEKQTIKIKEHGYYIECQLYGTPAGFADLTVIANSGYQKIPKERATGSFSIISNESQNKSVNGDINDLLRNKASGLDFQPNATNQSKKVSFNIRGQSTILSSRSPELAKDGFPYDGDIRNINPDDIDYVTVMKDAAASSIWGAISANGVINLSTKRSKRNDPLRTELNINTTIGEKYNAFNDPNYMGASDYLNVEQFLFRNKHYDATLTNTTTRPATTPGVDIFAKRRAGIIDAADSARQIDALSANDIRRDLNKYYFQQSVNQQYSLTVSRGGPKGAISFLAGWKKSNSPLTRNSYERFNIGFNNVFYPIEKLEMQTSFFLTDSKSSNHNGGISSVTMHNRKIYPYARLADDDGNPAVVAREISQRYKDTTKAALDWNYRPLQDLRSANNITRLNDILFNFGAQYYLYKGLRIEGKLQVEKQLTNTRNLQSEDLYFTRDLINKYFNPLATGDKKYGIPRGSIFDEINANLLSIRSRFQINIDTSFGKHTIAAIIGSETGSVTNTEVIKRFYGYSTNKNTNSGNLDYKTPLPIFQNLRPKSTIPNIDDSKTTRDETISYFMNASYSYAGRYIISASSRIDQANFFGSAFNNKNVLLGSVGMAWKISEEDFYSIYWLRDLKLRATYGSGGNANRNVPAILSVDLLPVNALGLGSAAINNPNNPYLGWERSNTLNVAIDFASLNHRVTGAIEYYAKKADNLMEMRQVAPSAGLAGQGMRGFLANGAGMINRGAEVEINAKILNGNFKWTTRLIYNYNTNKITHYSDTFPGATIAKSGGGSSGNITPVVGKPLHYIYSYPWAGLDPNDGDPRGIADNKISKDYTLLNNLPIDKLVAHGPALPTSTGVIANTFTYKKRVTLLFNIAYRLGYYFRAPSLSYYALFNTGHMHKDYAKRWKESGDELTTQVPSMKYVTNTARDAFYTNAAINVHKADNIRLQDIKITYEFNKTEWRHIPATTIRLYFYVNNVALLWKANKLGLDPDFISGYATPRSYTIGIKADFK
ncbi:SusC/RagA family TonB-linked outer membrane protein [Niastella caeni]|uniref:SusC/RagA family TonB-linked outer membrane protein n=1 Tax=Niastella caeni TaxID=2569763 RepID=A0A4S8HUC6_9BACT|nr:SusC/RagA family TonB-linked outer membrane protein [Niastella caeni]THU39203.1 SusC/RagA family TonB-linked outer membrane protein [Niastella caeni]